MRAIARDAAKAERERERQKRSEAAAHRRALVAAERQSKADAKEKKRLYLESRTEEADDLNSEINEIVQKIQNILPSALTRSPRRLMEAGLRVKFIPHKFDETSWAVKMPNPAFYETKPLSFLERLIPGSAKRFEAARDANAARFEDDRRKYNEIRARRDDEHHKFRENELFRKKENENENEKNFEFIRKAESGEHDAVVEYFERILKQGTDHQIEEATVEVGYSQESKHLVVDLELPDIDVVPLEDRYKYIRPRDIIEATPRSPAKRKALYASLIAQLTLKALDAVFRSVPAEGVVECLTVNGMLDAIDPATGQTVRPCLVSVRVTADVFAGLNLAAVQPEQCLRNLKASVSRSPDELLAVKPIVELNMVDPRFIDSMDVMSGLDSRQNLMELSPNEFENLITNLFATMGLDTKQTQASRDGGVDCVAFDSRPVFGGKVVIQAKRYKNTVGVSAVRDLFGTVQNEGATKGILVTTSGYGKAAFSFAEGKPLELLDGSNLLYLLQQHAGIDARIIMPDEWKDRNSHEE